ncbi:alpha/beta hydrolase [Devosia sediminis]|uniref:Alpha/beta hydrolase n=1 Tax=Devosia sediminis TaxID=2798801 RepID=A0A934MM07_9HYPH|nr:alpha/beta hydrolase [Devosia sediminis]MBJ3785206.1 alpha/beta hydrolase [Devosia sediminis]
MRQIVFVHGMFQNPKSWGKWLSYFEERGYECLAPAWPLHEGEPAALRANPPDGLGELDLKGVLASVEQVLLGLDAPVVIGHSVGGLVAQIMLNRGLAGSAVAISPVAPNAMVDLDWGFIKNSATIANPLKGNEPVEIDAKTFHAAFANTLSEAEAAAAFEQFATHDSRNVLRSCLGPDGHVDLDREHGPLLLIGAEEDQIIPAHLVEKNAEAYEDSVGMVSHRAFPGRSHYICGEPGWEEVAAHIAQWLEENSARPGDSLGGPSIGTTQR